MLVKCSTATAQSFLQCFEGEIFGVYTPELVLMYLPMEDDDDAIFSLIDDWFQLVRSSWPLPIEGQTVITTIEVAIPQ